MALGHPHVERATLALNKVDGSAEQRATERQFSRDRIAQRVSIPADGQLTTMLDSGTFSLSGLGARPVSRSSGSGSRSDAAGVAPWPRFAAAVWKRAGKLLAVTTGGTTSVAGQDGDR